VLALLAAIAAFWMRFFGVIFIAIPAVILGIIALYGGDRKLGMTESLVLAFG
jgi:hypothetical protein